MGPYILQFPQPEGADTAYYNDSFKDESRAYKVRGSMHVAEHTHGKG